MTQRDLTNLRESYRIARAAGYSTLLALRFALLRRRELRSR